MKKLFLILCLLPSVVFCQKLCDLVETTTGTDNDVIVKVDSSCNISATKKMRMRYLKTKYFPYYYNDSVFLVSPLVKSGHTTYSLTTVPINLGGTGATVKQSAYDNLSPNSNWGDITYWNGTHNVVIPPNTSTVLQTLQMIGNGTLATSLAWSPLPVARNLNYYFLPSASNIATFYQMLVTPSNVKTALSYTNLAAGTYTLVTFATDLNNPNLTYIPAGEFSIHLHAAEISGTKIVTLTGNIYEVNSTGTIINLITSCGPSLDVNAVEGELIFAHSTVNTYTLQSSASRIIIKIVGVIAAGGGGNVDLALYVGGSADSHLSFPSPAVSSASYVPVSGSQVNVDLNAKVLSNATLFNIRSFDSIYFGMGNTNVNSNLFFAAGATPISGWEIPLQRLTTGTQNTMYGDGTGLRITSGNANTALGQSSFQNNTTGNYNTATGRAALVTCLSGSDNTANGYLSLYSVSTGSNNCAVGSNSAAYVSTGSFNTVLGSKAAATGLSTGSGNTWIGYNVGGGWSSSSSNLLAISNSNDATPLIYGDFSTNALTINGSMNVTTSLTAVTPPFGDNSTNVSTTAFSSSLVTTAISNSLTAYSTNTVTLTNKRITLRNVTTSPSATPVINTDNGDIFTIAAQNTAITSFTSSLTGTPVDGDMMEIQVTDDGTARAITWGAKFEATTTALPTTTVISVRLRVLFQYNSVTAKWSILTSI